jgi:hypothetical protein
MKQFIAFWTLVLLVLLLTSPRHAQAQLRIDVAPTLGYGADVPNQVGDRGSISAGALAHLYLNFDLLSLIINPDVDYYLTEAEGITALQADVNLLLSLGEPGRSLLMPYIGIGGALTRVSGNDPRTDASPGVESGLMEGTDIGLNLLLGSAFGQGNVRAFVQGRYTLGSHQLYYEDQDNPSPSAGFGVQSGILFRITD